MGLGWSVEHPTVSEQAIRSAAKTSVLVVGLRFFFSAKFGLAKFVLPQATEFRVDGVLRNRLMRVMVGHLLLLSSA
jgi:hypothetical protein